MHALIVVAHHDPQSLTHAVAAQVAAGLSSSGHTVEIADLAAEGFDPRYTCADHLVHRTRATPPADVLAEQARIDRADALVLVFPIYWWSLPGLLKGWIDRVLRPGVAYRFLPGDSGEGVPVGLLRALRTGFLGLAVNGVHLGAQRFGALVHFLLRLLARGGQIASTATARGIANSTPFPASIQAMKVSRETAITAGTNQPDTRSARR